MACSPYKVVFIVAQSIIMEKGSVSIRSSLKKKSRNVGMCGFEFGIHILKIL